MTLKLAPFFHKDTSVAGFVDSKRAPKQLST